MMERIDIFTPKLTDCPSFVVNNAVDSVPVTMMAVEKVMYSGDGKRVFTNADAMIVLSTGYFIPERFVLWNYENVAGEQLTNPHLQLRLKENTGAFWAVFGFGSAGVLPIPFPNYEFSIGGFIDPAEIGLTGVSYELFCKFGADSADRLQISMIDVPASLNTKTFYIVPFVKVLHTLSLS